MPTSNNSQPTIKFAGRLYALRRLDQYPGDQLLRHGCVARGHGLFRQRSRWTVVTQLGEENGAKVAFREGTTVLFLWFASVGHSSGRIEV